MWILCRSFNFMFGALWGISALYYVLQGVIVYLQFFMGHDVAEMIANIIGSPLAGIVTPYCARIAKNMHIPFVVK